MEFKTPPIYYRVIPQGVISKFQVPRMKNHSVINPTSIFHLPRVPQTSKDNTHPTEPLATTRCPPFKMKVFVIKHKHMNNEEAAVPLDVALVSVGVTQKLVPATGKETHYKDA